MSSSSRSGILAQLARDSSLISKAEKKLDGLHKKPHKPKEIEFVGGNILDRFDHQLQEAKCDLTDLHADARRIFPFLTPHVSVQRCTKGDDKTYIKTPIPDDCRTIAKLDDFAPEVLFCFGNNDLNHVEFAAGCYRNLAKLSKAPHLVVVSGRGGHGTVPGVIFGLSEAETMTKRLIELGVPADKIVTEPHSTNTGENIRFTDALIQQEFKHISFTSTISTCLRQLSSFFHQSAHPWERISILAPSWKHVKEHYFSNKTDSMINFLYMLREIATFLDYTVNEKLMCPKFPLDHEEMNQAIELLVKYYNLISNNRINARELIGKFMSALHQKATGEIDPALKADMGVIVAEISNYFRCMFNIIEKQCMKVLPPMSAWRQSAAMDLNRVFSRSHLDVYSLENQCGGEESKTIMRKPALR